LEEYPPQVNRSWGSILLRFTEIRGVSFSGSQRLEECCPQLNRGWRSILLRFTEIGGVSSSD
jgi:hypothetical protein